MGSTVSTIVQEHEYESPTVEVGFVAEQTESEFWQVVIGGALLAFYIWQCQRSGGRVSIGRWGPLYYVTCR